MRILQLITYSELRGAEVFAAQLSEQLAGRGHEVCLASLYAPVSGRTGLKSDKTVQRVELNGRRVGRLEPGTFCRLIQQTAQFRPDVVQANGFHALKYASLTKQLTGAGWPIVYRNISIAGRWIAGRIQRHWGRWLLRCVDRVLSVSDASAADFHRTYGFPESRIETVRRGILVPDDPRTLESRRRVAELIAADADDPLLFHIGGFTAEKNHTGLLDAFARIRHQFPSARLILCGDGPLRAEVESQILEMGLERSIHALGNRSDARDLLAGADLLLLPSHVEGIPGVVLEAAARRVPSACTNVGGVSEAIADRVSGRIVPAGDMQSLANAACELLADESQRRRCGAAAHDHILSHHEMGRTVDRFEQVYAELSGSRFAATAACSATC